MAVLGNLILAIIGYFVGSVSPAIIISKIKGGKDVRDNGTKNAGATNVYYLYGKLLGFLVMWLDAFKIVVAVAVSYILLIFTNFFNSTYIHFAAIGAIIGHIFPIYFGFKGGKGAACILGYFLTSMWILVPLAVTIWIVIAVKRKNAILASLIVISSAAISYLGIELILGVLGMQQIWLTPFLYIPSLNVYEWWINWTFLFAMCSIALGAQVAKSKFKK